MPTSFESEMTQVTLQGEATCKSTSLDKSVVVSLYSSDASKHEMEQSAILS